MKNVDKNAKIRIAFFKAGTTMFHKIVRYWTKSSYSHVEIVLPDNETWVSISPFIFKHVAARIMTNVGECDWDFIELSVTHEELSALKDFISETTGDGYDWVGMLLSQFLPVIIKSKGMWYCSSWVFFALLYAGILKSKNTRIYETPALSPGKLHELLTHDVAITLNKCS